ncbi:hypothetical protein [Prevotella sp. kh1p2]|uniref:hypothetical protein n=1 Tax=Prevotella sp. kh1p2 TaxID=1761883 RepID=UPI0008D8CFCC|nr:hypothetical protein [Prevotella sp. kh1p2]SET31146.1 hypothetical protein SAMN04487825_1381 [Prevotella sp. kh1p2]SNU12589.1 hypothetical protein SAMN06298210_1373 [Prevotellaceae bacterium KH2P17]
MLTKILAEGLLLLMSLPCNAQTDTPFKGYLYNSEYDVYIHINLYENDIVIPGQELFGAVSGYFGDNKDSRKWIFTSAKIKNNKEADLEIINDYGSEDLTAKLIVQNDSTCTLQQEEGSTLKIARNRKWVKMPKKLDFVRK